MRTHLNIFPWLKLALLALSATLFFGFLAALRYQTGAWLDDYLSFRKLRPLHVSSAVGWIFASAIGLILHARKAKPETKEWLMLSLYTVTGLAILLSYALGFFGGREYWEFNALFAAPILLFWWLFGKALLRSYKFTGQQVPVYRWMWLTGLFFFAFTFLESMLWHLPAIHGQPVRETALQWKSYGSLVGSWNMLVYGSAAWLGRRLENQSDSTPDRWQEGALYLLSLTNLMFNWSHHIYDMPVSKWILQLGFYISMTELLVLFLLLKSFRLKIDGRPAARLLWFSELWVLVNLVSAIGLSVPWLNRFTHGTFVTVAHAMGTTIGINSMILLAGIAYHGRLEISNGFNKWLNVLQLSLLFFLISLFVIGLYTGLNRESMADAVLRSQLRPYVKATMLLGMCTALCFIPVLKMLYCRLSRPADAAAA